MKSNDFIAKRQLRSAGNRYNNITNSYNNRKLYLFLILYRHTYVPNNHMYASLEDILLAITEPKRNVEQSKSCIGEPYLKRIKIDGLNMKISYLICIFVRNLRSLLKPQCQTSCNLLIENEIGTVKFNTFQLEFSEDFAQKQFLKHVHMCTSSVGR